MANTDDGIEEAQIAGLTVRIDRYLCVGFGDCIEASPTLFVFDDEGIATFGPEHAGVEPSEVVESCRTCPVDALVVLDEDGTQIVP